MSCVPKSPVLSKILPFTNNDVRYATEYLSTIEDNDFTAWYKTITGREFDKENITDTSVDAVKAYNNRTTVNTQDYIQNVRTSRTGIFGNDVAKEDHAINVLTTMFLKAEGAINKKIKEAKKQKDEAKERDDIWVKKLLIGQLQSHLKNNKENLTSEQISFVSTLIKDLFDGGNYNSNTLFELVVNSPEAINLSKQFGINTIEDFDVEEDANENSEQDTRSKDGETVETLKADWTELADQRKNVDKNVSRDVKEWFAKLVKTKSTKFVNDKPDANTDTYSGIPETVSFAESFKLINNYANFSNIDRFIDSLHTIAARFKEGSHLENAARLLEDSNNELMRNKIFVQLKQSIWLRNEVSQREGKTSVAIKNRNTFPKLNLINKVLNSFDKYILNPVAITEDDALLNTLKNRIEATNSISDEILFNEELEQVSEELASLINKYNLGITREGLINYINNKSGGNINNILSVIDDLLEFNKVITNTSEIVARNNTLRAEHYKQEYRKRGDDDSYVIEPFDESLLTSTEGAGNKIANRIGDRFKDYQIVNNEFNSINAENNLVSDILKNNYISKFFDRVNNKDYNDNPTDNLEFRDYLVQFLDIPAYRNTNILVEQNLGDGKVIPGFLRVSEQGGYELTPYYREFGAELFNGIRNEATGKSKSYKDINALEWDIVMLNEYANSNDSFEITKGVRRAKFFTQTPSDAPKTFIVNSYKLDIRGLYQSDAINHNHGIYVGFLNNFTKELNAMAQAIDYLFETEDRDGIVVLKDDKLIVKKEFENLRESDARLNYHYRDAILKNGKPTGNVFQFRSLLIDKNSNDASENLNKVFSEDGLVSLLYGGSTSEVYMTRDSNGELKINIDGNIMNAIHSYIENYIKHRVNEGVAKYVDKKQFVDRYKNSSEAEFKNFIAEMVLNYEIQYNNLNDMFFGDEAFYMNSRDTIKRNKEYQAGGLCYAAFDLYNKQREFGNGIKVSNTKTIPITSSFKYITIEDVTNDGSVLEDLEQQLNLSGASAETKDFILSQFSKNRSEVTDAQSFITLDEFVRRMYLRGEYDNYKELVEALYDESKPIDGKLMNDLNKFIQVQKNFYYDLEIDNGLANPVQIKNAEFVLIPRFLGNTELGLLAKYMIDNGISQANFTSTEKATTSKVLTFWDSEGNIPSNEGESSPLKEFEGKLSTHYKTGWYSNLYTQQDTPQHMQGENKAGLQVVKKLIDNIDGTPEGQALINDFFDCLTANIQDSFNDVASRIGVQINSKGEVIYDGDTIAMDIDKFVALIKDELTRRGLDSNYRKYAEINPETGLPYMPAWSNLVRSKLESIVNSIFTNNITSQKLRGFHASQVANIGMNALGEKVDKKKLSQTAFEETNGYSLGRKLRYHPNGSQIIEVLLPKWMVAAYNSYDAEGNLIHEVTLEDLQREGLDTMIGYRIPTEGKQSIGVMKVVGLLNETQGSTIVLPDDWVLQTGADYDIDSVYGIYHATYFDKNGKPKKIQYIDGNDEESINKRYYNYIINSLDREDVKDAIDLARELKEEGYNYRESFNSAITKFAESNNLYSKEEFSQLSIAQQNTRDARNNKIVDTFISIMNLSASVGENLSSSNFEDIKKAKVNIFGKQVQYLNINSVIAQNWYRDTNMSGARLKAISVNRDNFVSISNRTKTTISGQYGGFKFKYKYSSESVAKKKLTELRDRFGKENVSRDGDTIFINHNRLGWSEDNLNIDGRLITAYSSETTALILDGVKEGGVRNVDLYTFDVYKSIVDCGSNYETSILFINQPVITELINRQNAIDNVFGESGINPLITLKKDLYIKYLEAVTGNKITDKERKRLSANEIKKKLDVLAETLKTDTFNENTFIEEGIDVELLRTNLGKSLDSNDIKDIENHIRTLIAFEHYKKISEQINSNMMVITSDKFGAGKSVNEIDSVIGRINGLKASNRKNADTANPILTSSYSMPLIDAIYPRTEFNDINSINTDKSISAYPSLYYQLKYSCIATKMLIQDSGIFKTQSPDFKELVKSFGVKNIKSIQNLESFLINVSQAQSSFVNTNRFITTSSNEFIPSYNINLITSQDDARARLYGYTEIVGKFDITDLSESNIQNFMKLSPANKVAIMQSATNDANLFKILNVEYKGKRNTHDKITIIDSTISTESQYQMFRNIWNNNNPFVKLTAMDLVRYSIAVEGYRFKGGTVSKIVPVELLYTEDNGIDSNNGLSTGTGIMVDSDRAINNLIQDNNSDNASIETLKDIFYRSNPNNPDILTFENKRYKDSPKIIFNSLGMSTITAKDARVRNIIRGSESDEGIVSYVKTNDNQGNQVLYKVVEEGNFIHLLPLNRLEENEIGSVSINPDNNNYLPISSFMKVLEYDMNVSNVNILANAIKTSNRKFISNGILFADDANTEYAFDNVTVVTTPVEESSLNDSSTRYIIKSSNKEVIINNINVLEKQGIKNYIVLVPDDSYEDIRAYISRANAIDEANQREAIANEKIANNEIQLRTKNSDNSESPYYSQLKASVNKTLADVQVNGIGFVPVLQTVIDNTGFRSGGYVRYTKEGKDYILTNLGRITSKSIKLTKDYLHSKSVTENNMLKLVYPRRSAIEQVIKENSMLDRFSTNNIIRVQTEESFQNEDVLESAIVDNDIEINNYIAKTIESVERNNANVNEDALTDAFRSFNMLDIRANSANKLNDAMREQALKVINGYINRRIDDFLFTLNNFYVVRDEDGDFVESWGITNKKLFDKMIEDEELRTKYEMFLDDIHRFISDYSIIESLQLYNIDEAIALVETQEELDGLRRTNEILKQIKDKFTRISSLNNTLSRSTKMYFDTYISSLTNDPRIKSGMLEITAAIEDENFFQYYLADSQETHVPIVQIVLKKMMQQLRKAEIDSRDRRISFTSEVSKIIENAKNAGISVALDDILDDSGNLVLPYDESFVETIRTLKDNIKIAQIRDPEGRNGIQYKKAKDALEKFLTENMERQYERRMYEDYYKLDQMLDKYPATYIKLKKLMQEEAEILSTMVDNDYNTLTEQNQNRLEAILDAIQDMRSTIDSDGNYKENYYEANAVNNYFEYRRHLNLKYKYQEAKPAYEERYKQAIENLNYPKDSEIYKEAEEWLKANTISRLKAEVRESISNAYKETRRKNPLTSYLRTMMKGKYDANGIVDGTKFSDVQVANIKNHEEQMLAAAVNRSAPNEANANAYLDSIIEWRNTSYYQTEYIKANNLGKEEFETWYKANHVYNPITEKYEPLKIWQQQVILNEAEVMEHFPKPKWLETKVKPEFINDNYVEGKLQASSDRYKNSKYYNMNEYQKQLHESVSSLLDELVKDKRSRAYIGKGYLPNQAVEKENKGFEDYWQAFKRSHGWYDAPNKSDIELNLYKRFSNAPMLHSLSQVKLLPIREQQEGETKEEYATYVEETLAANRELHKQRMEETKEMNNPNVLERLNTFIDQMYLFNSRNDIARLAKLTIAQLKNTDFIKRAPNGTLSTNRLLGRITGNEEIRTEKNENSNIVRHFESQVRKLVFNEFELDEGTKSKVSRVLRNMVSSKFMMLNITGGIANVLYGKTQVQMEMAAGTYFKYRDFRKAENEYAQSIGSYFADAYSETTTSETNGIVRLFNILESDMATETYGKGNNPLGKLEDLLFITQSAGEHYMQNTTLLAMLNSHRVFVDDNGKASAISYDTFAQNLREETLIKVLNETNPELITTYNEYREKIKKSFAVLEQFNRFKQDMVTNFLRSQPSELRAKFVEQYKEATKTQKEIFEGLPTLRSQLELKNGVGTLKADSPLTNADIADFRNKVIAVNHHIHGIYDKIGANILQQSWAGALVMQFHKHLVPGFQKRFGYRLGHFDGIYSETRESVNKGSYISFAEFLTMPFRKYYELNNSNELQAVRTLQGIGKAYTDFFGNMITYYNILPEYDKANIRRVLSEWVAIAKAIALFVAGKLLLDEDDDSTQIADYILYSADRLMSESIQYNPYGAANELQKLYSNPVAAFSIASDTYKMLAGCCSYIVTGNPDDIIYESGTYAGENKIAVNLLKQVPLVNQWRKHQRLGSNNSYYKVRQSPFSGISQFIANLFTDEEE